MSSTGIPVHVDKDTTLRVKIVDACGLTCTFCHNEGTPVAVDNRKQPLGESTTAGASARVSIYAATNGAGFLPAAVPADEEFGHVLAALRDALGFTEVHLTGGEPTLHPSVAKLTSLATHAGYRVGMTSNGEHGERVLPDCAAAGLNRVNFSIFGTTPAELAEVQHARYANAKLAARKIAALKRSIATCEEHGVKASANIVVLDHSYAPRAHRLLDECSPHLSVRLLNSLDHGSVSIEAIERILTERGAVAEAHYITAGVSGTRTAYRLPDGRRASLEDLLGRVADRFFRVEPRRRAGAYVRGLLAPLADKNGWTLAEASDDVTPLGMQRLLNAATWDVEGMRDDVRAYVAGHLGHADGVLIVDETGFLKKGTTSAGVELLALPPLEVDFGQHQAALGAVCAAAVRACVYLSPDRHSLARMRVRARGAGLLLSWPVLSVCPVSIRPLRSVQADLPPTLVFPSRGTMGKDYPKNVNSTPFVFNASVMFSSLPSRQHTANESFTRAIVHRAFLDAQNDRARIRFPRGWTPRLASNYHRARA